jgi:hypothetical protein
MPSIEAKCEAKCRVGLRWCRAPRGPDAESVTHSGKICGSPRSALLQTAAL